MTVLKINKIIEALQHEQYRWTPVRRIHIPKKNSAKMRPLGMPTWSDKLLQEVIRSVLDAYWEPQFSDHSHGFRPGRGCHTALCEVRDRWIGTKWYVEGDVRGFFDNICHSTLLKILSERIHDNRFIELIRRLLQAGYFEHWQHNVTLSGTPQGGVLSPLLANIYLDKLDRFVEQKLLPQYNYGKQRSRNQQYTKLSAKARRYQKQGKLAEAQVIRLETRQLPSLDTHDPDYRRLHYVRYADDWLLGFAGPKEEAKNIREQVAQFLREELRLELSLEKTLITHAQEDAARFLGYEIVIQHADDKLDKRGRRSVNGHVGLRLPIDVLHTQCDRYMRKGKPEQRPIWIEDDDYTIISHYQAEFRGIVNYYLLAHNVSWLNRLKWVMETSMLKTLAAKHRSTVSAMLESIEPQCKHLTDR